MVNDHIHTPSDGRGIRIVRVNGKVIDRVLYADTKRGIVRRADNHLKLDKWGKRVLTRTIRGKVTVEPWVECRDSQP